MKNSDLHCSFGGTRPNWVLVIVMTCLACVTLFLPEQLSAQSGKPVFNETDCPFDDVDANKEQIRCGYVDVPENWADPGNRTVRLVAAILKGRNSSPSATATVILSGGPGTFLVQGTKGWVNDELRDIGDLILFDQRGMGYSRPSLCPKLVDAWAALFAKDLAQTEETEALKLEAIQCRDDLLNRGIDPKRYNSTSNAADVNALRQALGYDKWNLYGVSYGTRLALITMRDHPEGVRSAVLDSPYPPQIIPLQATFDRALSRLFENCSKDPKCNNAFPDLKSIYSRALKRLTDQPLIVPLRHGTKLGNTAFLNEQDFRLILEQIMTGKSLFQYLPLLIDQISKGNPVLVHPLFVSLDQITLPIDLGAYYAIQCMDNAPFKEDPSNNLPFFSSDNTICQYWNREHLSSPPLSPVISDIPTFIAAGRFDPVTPPAVARLTASTLPNAFTYEVPYCGHVAMSSDCLVEIRKDFLLDPTVPPDGSCLSKITPFEFVEEPFLASGIINFGVDMYFNGPGLMAFLLGFGTIVFAVVILVWIINGLRRLFRKSVTRNILPARTIWLARITVSLATMFYICLAAVIIHTGLNTPFLLAFGLPTAARWILVLLPIIGILTALVFWQTVLIWKRQIGKRYTRICYSTIVPACVCFLVFCITILT